MTIISRLCVNHLQSARVRREQYVGQWLLPEPLVTDPQSDPFTGSCSSDSSRRGVNGNMEGLISLLSGDVVLHSGGGGKAIAVPNLIRGADKVARALTLGTRVLPKNLVARTAGSTASRARSAISTEDPTPP